MIERRKADKDRRARPTKPGRGRSVQPRRAVDAGTRPGNRGLQETIDAGYLALYLTPAEQAVVRVALCARRTKCAGWELGDLDNVLDKLEDPC